MLRNKKRTRTTGRQGRPGAGAGAVPKEKPAAVAPGSRVDADVEPKEKDGELCEEDMHTMMEYTCQLLIDDTFVTKDENNLFQECDI